MIIGKTRTNQPVSADENGVAEVVNKGIEEGKISVEEPLIETPLTPEDQSYELSISTSTDYIAISEASNTLSILYQLVGKYLYCYNGNALVAKGLILEVDSSNIQAFTFIGSTDVTADHYKIFNK